MHKYDVFRWRCKPGHDALLRLAPYWCRSQFAVFNGSELSDTYWHAAGAYLPAGGNVCWAPAAAAEQLDLTLLGNLEDYDVRAEPDPENYYDSAVLLDLRHPNGGSCYRRKNSKPSAAAQRARWLRELREAIARVKFCRERLHDLRGDSLRSDWP